MSREQLVAAGVSDEASKEASRIATSLAALLCGIPAPQSMAVVGYVLAESLRQTQEVTGSGSRPIDPQVTEWARQTFDPKEAAANLREIRETGGLSLADFDGELEQLARG